MEALGFQITPTGKMKTLDGASASLQPEYTFSVNERTGTIRMRGTPASAQQATWYGRMPSVDLILGRQIPDMIREEVRNELGVT
jgi:hypothetical protein